MQKQQLFKILIPLFYLAAMALAVFYVLSEQKTIRQDSGSPLYRNLMESSAFIRQGFFPEELRDIPFDNDEWTGFESTPLRVKNSLLANLPKRPFLSPKKIDAREYTILIPVILDDETSTFLAFNPSVTPGIFLAGIGENWEVFFNGIPVYSEMHLNESGQIKERRTWRNIYFPIDRNFIVPGFNILAIRVIGDPTHLMTGLSYNAPYYMDDYRLIEERQNKFSFSLLCVIFGIIGIYYLVSFLSLRKRKEILNLYFGIYSLLLCIYVAARHGLFRHLIPNSEITMSMEAGSLMLILPFFFMFIENLGRGRITKPTLVYLAVSVYFTVTQIFFPAQYREDVIVVWNIYTIFIHFPFVIIYDIIYFYLFDKKRIRTNDDVSNIHTINIIAGTLTVFFCAAFDILGDMFFNSSYSLFPYGNLVVLIGMNFTLASRFSVMYKQMEHHCAALEKEMNEREREMLEREKEMSEREIERREREREMHEFETAMHERVKELEEQVTIAEKTSHAKSNFFGIPIEYRRYDMLNHYRAIFDSGYTIDSEHFKEFTALLESLNVPDEMKGQSASLIEAGQREDAQTIREMLPAFCKAAQEYRKKETGGYQNTLAEILPRLKDALRPGETKAAETILSELGPVKLYPVERELYFMLYDFLVKNNTEKALDAIYFWERLQGGETDPGTI